MQAKSIKGNSTEEIKSALEQSMVDGFRPTLAIAFVSIKQDRHAICKLLDDAGIAIFGCSTNGEFIDEETTKGSAAILLLDISKDYSRFILKHIPKRITGRLRLLLHKKQKRSFLRLPFLFQAAIWKPTQKNYYLVLRI